MFEVNGKNYFIDLDMINKVCEVTSKDDLDDDEDDGTIINMFKYDIIKMMIERIMTEIDDNDDYDDTELNRILKKDSEPKSNTSFKIAFNTLTHYKILTEQNGR